jgi:nicotinate-nucleotide adenylyltransferase
MIQRVGLFFGSFNPVHQGHLAIAKAFKTQAKLDALWWVLSPQNPHKSISELAPFEHRRKMLALVIHEDADWICDIEAHLPLPSFTINTLEALSAEFPNKEWVLLLGEDSWNNLPTWKQGDVIENNYPIFVYPRQELNTIRQGKMTMISGSFHSISSTEIRNCIRTKNPSHCAILPEVADYIITNQLYN